MAGNYDGGAAVALEYQDIFGKGNFFLEIQDQGLEEERKIHAPTSSNWRKNWTFRWCDQRFALSVRRRLACA